LLQIVSAEAVDALFLPQDIQALKAL